MSLYDDCDVKTRTQENVVGWSSGIKLLQSQLQLKKAAVTQPKRDMLRKVTSLPPVIDLKTKSEFVSPLLSTIHTPPPFQSKSVKSEPQERVLPIIPNSSYKTEYDWNVVDEYDPLWPTEYEKIVKELRDHRDRDSDKEEKRRGDRSERRRRSRFNDSDDDVVATPQATLPNIGSGFAGRWADSEDDEATTRIREPATPSSRSQRSGGGGVGAAIAPPASLQEGSIIEPPSPKRPANTPYGGSVAAKIMARYGFKEGQGLGKQEQGMSMALQVEKTSKRGGRIIHENEVAVTPSPFVIDPGATPAPGGLGALGALGALESPPSNTQEEEEEDEEEEPTENEPSITEIMKKPSKVVLLRNMVGPGEVDDDLEPEVKEECNTKYGEVGSVVINELPEQVPEEAVRIFVEFSRIESAIKAVVDLNGRFFGGRQVKATFYDTEQFYNFQLND